MPNVRTTRFGFSAAIPACHVVAASLAYTAAVAPGCPTRCTRAPATAILASTPRSVTPAVPATVTVRTNTCEALVCPVTGQVAYWVVPEPTVSLLSSYGRAIGPAVVCGP